jgi:general stress protein YciG
MGWVTLDDNFPNHPKAMRSGPLASYLYVCGLCYCRRYHTDGFIPANAVKMLGASTNPRRLVDTLIAAGLWERADGGFQVHDYATIYPNDAGDKERREANRQKKRDAGRKGGQASWAKRNPKQTEAPAEVFAQAEPKHAASTSAEPLNRSGVGVDAFASVPVLERELRIDDPPMDEWFDEVWKTYPSQRRTRSARAQQGFVEEMTKHPGGPYVAWTLFKANLALNIANQGYGEGHGGVHLRRPMAERVSARRAGCRAPVEVHPEDGLRRRGISRGRAPWSVSA